MKINYLLLLPLTILSFQGYGQSPKQQNHNINVKQNNSVQLNWKTYTNDKYGFTFQYPETWFIQDGKNAEVVDLSGIIIGIQINFIDTISHTTLLVAYSLAPNGTELYKFATSQPNTSKLIVAGNNAVKSQNIMSKDGRGNLLNPQLSSIIVDFMDKKQSGEFQIQFQTYVRNNKIESSKFDQVLSSFKFIN